MNAVIKYPGSKWRIAQWIIAHFPEHHSYLEPFFGSGAVLFNKRRSNIETINDLDGDVVNLFQQIRDDPDRLAEAIYWTPYARAEYERAWAAQRTEEDPFRRAVDFYIRMMMGRGFRTTGEKVGWKNDVQGREASYAAGCWCNTPDTIRQAAERLRKVQIECRPAVDLIRRFNFKNVLIYADPPYVLETRHGKQYRHEMSDVQHEELLQVLIDHKGPALISGYDSEIYRDMLHGWHREEIAERAQTSGLRTEVLWMNFEPMLQESLWENETKEIMNHA